jgi:hypothetical protein
LTFALALLAAAGLAFAACKQGPGDRCQTSDDCEGGLTCNQAEHVCSSSSSSVDDAEPPADAPDDAPDIDAPIDAPIDAR